MAETARLFGGTYIPAGAQQFADGSALTGASAAPVASLPERVTLVVERHEFTAFVRAHGDADLVSVPDRGESELDLRGLEPFERKLIVKALSRERHHVDVALRLLRTLCVPVSAGAVGSERRFLG